VELSEDAVERFLDNVELFVRYVAGFSGDVGLCNRDVERFTVAVARSFANLVASTAVEVRSTAAMVFNPPKSPFDKGDLVLPPPL